MEWQPIETAPKYGPILAVITGRRERWRNQIISQPTSVACVAWFWKWYGDPELAGWVLFGHDEEYGEILIATHWMPLPEPPNG